jgi:hypothetical protein
MAAQDNSLDEDVTPKHQGTGVAKHCDHSLQRDTIPFSATPFSPRLRSAWALAVLPGSNPKPAMHGGPRHTDPARRTAADPPGHPPRDRGFDRLLQAGVRPTFLAAGAVRPCAMRRTMLRCISRHARTY